MQNVTYKAKKKNHTYFWWFMDPSNNIIIKHLTGFNPPILFACPKLGHIPWRGPTTPTLSTPGATQATHNNDNTVANPLHDICPSFGQANKIGGLKPVKCYFGDATFSKYQK
jgi:hypothetical protein